MEISRFCLNIYHFLVSILSNTAVANIKALLLYNLHINYFFTIVYINGLRLIINCSINFFLSTCYPFYPIIFLLLIEPSQPIAKILHIHVNLIISFSFYLFLYCFFIIRISSKLKYFNTHAILSYKYCNCSVLYSVISRLITVKTLQQYGIRYYNSFLIKLIRVYTHYNDELTIYTGQ